MGTLESLLLGAGLSMDAFAVTISDMFSYRGTTKRRALLLPLFFGLFQGGMPLIGYFAGRLVSSFIEKYAGILTLAILGIIGAKMIFDAVRELRSKSKESGGPKAQSDVSGKRLTVGVMLLQAVATSIDALCVGVSLAAQNADPLFVCLIIALTTFALSFVAVLLGRRFGAQLGEKATIVGGIVLIAIGVKAMLF